MKDTLKILFIEDVKIDAELIWHELQKNNIVFDKILVDSKKEFLDGLRSFEPDLIISDYSLPQFDGMKALLLRNDLAPLTPFIMVTGSINEEVAVECLKSGANDYILKENLSRLGPAVVNSINKIKLLKEKQDAEEALRHSELRFKQISENFGEWIWEVDKNGLYTYSSPIVKELLGYEPEELVNKKYFYDFFPPGVRDQLKQAALAAIAGKENFKNFINVNLHKDGRELILSTCGFALLDKNGNLMGYRGVDTDITERKMAEEALIESEMKYRQLVTRSPDGIFIVDLSGKFLSVNSTICNNLKYSEGYYS
jgi:two-component system sensor histidine kinase/response regulator